MVGLDPKKEEPTLKLVAAAAIIVLTIGLLTLNTTGAWQASNGNPYYTTAIAGAELLVLAALGLAILARTWPRRIVAGLITASLIWVCLENGKMAVQFAMDDVFTGTPTELTERAELADRRADELDDDAEETTETDKTTLSELRAEVANLRLEQELMQSSNRIEEAQRLLVSNGYYDYAIDGVNGPETERAMRAYGEMLRNRIASLNLQIEALTATPVAVPAPEGDEAALAAPISPAELKRQEAIDLRRQAQEVEERTLWLIGLLLALELARSAAVWALLMVTTARAVNMIRTAEEARDMAEANKRVMEINAEIASMKGEKTEPIGTEQIDVEPVEPETSEAETVEIDPIDPIEPEEIEPVDEAPAAGENSGAGEQIDDDLADLLEPEPEEEPEPEPQPELTDRERISRAGGLASGHNKAAERAAQSRILRVGDESEWDRFDVFEQEAAE